MSHHDDPNWKGVPLGPAPEGDGEFPVIEQLRHDGKLFRIDTVVDAGAEILVSGAVHER